MYVCILGICRQNSEQVVPRQQETLITDFENFCEEAETMSVEELKVSFLLSMRNARIFSYLYRIFVTGSPSPFAFEIWEVVSVIMLSYFPFANYRSSNADFLPLPSSLGIILWGIRQ